MPDGNFYMPVTNCPVHAIPTFTPDPSPKLHPHNHLHHHVNIFPPGHSLLAHPVLYIASVEEWDAAEGNRGRVHRSAVSSVASSR